MLCNLNSFRIQRNVSLREFQHILVSIQNLYTWCPNCQWFCYFIKSGKFARFDQYKYSEYRRQRAMGHVQLWLCCGLIKYSPGFSLMWLFVCSHFFSWSSLWLSIFSGFSTRMFAVLESEYLPRPSQRTRTQQQQQQHRQHRLNATGKTSIWL